MHDDRRTELLLQRVQVFIQHAGDAGPLDFGLRARGVLVKPGKHGLPSLPAPR